MNVGKPESERNPQTTPDISPQVSPDNDVYRVVLVDDDAEMLNDLSDSLRSEPSIEIAAVTSEAVYAEAMVNKFHPQVALIDVEMPQISGIEVCRRLKELFPSVGVIMLTNFRHDDWLKEALDAGADGFITKDTPRDEIVAAIRKVSRGGQVMSTRPLKMLTDTYQLARKGVDPAFQSSLESLTVAERKVWQMILEAKTNHQIARTLSIEEATVKTHVSKVMQKFGAGSRTELLLQAARNGKIR